MKQPCPLCCRRHNCRKANWWRRVLRTEPPPERCLLRRHLSREVRTCLNLRRSRRTANWLNRHSRLRFRGRRTQEDRKSTRLNSSHGYISYAVFCLKNKKNMPRVPADAKDLNRLDLEYVDLPLTAKGAQNPATLLSAPLSPALEPGDSHADFGGQQV